MQRSSEAEAWRQRANGLRLQVSQLHAAAVESSRLPEAKQLEIVTQLSAAEESLRRAEAQFAYFEARDKRRWQEQQAQQQQEAKMRASMVVAAQQEANIRASMMARAEAQKKTQEDAERKRVTMANSDPRIRNYAAAMAEVSAARKQYLATLDRAALLEQDPSWMNVKTSFVDEVMAKSDALEMRATTDYLITVYGCPGLQRLGTAKQIEKHIMNSPYAAHEQLLIKFPRFFRQPNVAPPTPGIQVTVAGNAHPCPSARRNLH